MGELLLVVVAAEAGVADLVDGDDVDGGVELAVAAAAEPVPAVVAAGGVDGGGPVEAGEVVGVGNGNRATSPRQATRPGSAEGTTEEPTSATVIETVAEAGLRSAQEGAGGVWPDQATTPIADRPEACRAVATCLMSLDVVKL